MTMAEAERPHRASSLNNSNTTDLFICFTSRFSSSSSSMRLSSKSILSPARSASLTTSLSRRLRSSGSLKTAAGGVLASPMFSANGRKRSGSGYDNNPEPSSPKVTCIGQVRVKTRKHVKKKMRARARRRGEASFRRSTEPNDAGGCRFDATESRWVHLPVTICESLRAFGSELNCFSPCRWSCSGRDRDASQQENHGCGAVFTRWFVAVEETGGKRREIELVVGREDGAERDERRRSRRRHVFEGLDFSEIDVKPEKREKEEGEEVGRIGMSAPPKNALLLMRCRSDPVKVAALANRVRETQMCLNDDVEAEEEEAKDVTVEEDGERRRIEMGMEDKKRIETFETWISGEVIPESNVAEAEPASVSRVEEEDEEVHVAEDSAIEAEEWKVQQEVEETFMRIVEDDIRNAIEEEEQAAKMTEKEEDREEEEEEFEEDIASATRKEERPEPDEKDNPEKPEPDPICPAPETTEKETAAPPYNVLPECLLLMMCEPKLSMEVSKETWVCKTDFVRWLPERPPAKKTDGGGGRDQQPKKRNSAAESNASSRRRSTDKAGVTALLLQPPRSSCSYPRVAGGSSKGYEPPVLPRCKSEPRHHPPATLGLGF